MGGQQRLHLLQGGVDAVAAALLGDLVRGALAGEVGAEFLRVGDAGEAGAVEEVLVVGFGGEEQGVVVVGRGGCVLSADGRDENKGI